MVAILAWLLFDHWIYASGPLLRTLSLLALIAIATWFVVRRVWPVLTSRVSEEYAAWALEQGHSDYRQQLTSYVTLKTGRAGQGAAGSDRECPRIASRGFAQGAR